MENDISLTEEDVQEALKQLGSYVDVTIEDLMKIFELALENARKRAATAVPISTIMTGKVVSVKPDDDVTALVRLLAENNISGLPVIDEQGVVVGVVSEADILGSMDVKREVTLLEIVRGMFTGPRPEDRGGEKVRDIMSKPPITIRPETNIREAAHILAEKKIKRLPVVDAENKLIGIISRADIVLRAARKR